jgi:group II intron reverse transcriptase/maturase/CRISPR-associated endonuclease Cas1
LNPPTLQEIASSDRLKAAWDRVKLKKSAGGVDGVTVDDFARNEAENLQQLAEALRQGTYVPEPLRHARMEKPGKSEYRNLGMPSVRNKIVHTALADLLVPFYDKLFSNCSYAYRPGKGTIKAVGRVRDFLKRKCRWVALIDIDDFFDTIDHEKCIEILSRKLTDPGVLRIIRLYLSQGILKYDRWEDTYDGVPQGGVLSPVLSNVYLNELDQFLHGRQADFVRYADDLVILGRDREPLVELEEAVRTFLKDTLSLGINPADEPVISTSRGFPFIGIFFHKGRIKIDYDRMDEKVERIRRYLAGRKNLDAAVTRTNRFLNVVSRYYAKLMPDSHQVVTLENRILNEISRFIARGRTEGFIETKKACRTALEALEFIGEKTEAQRNRLIETIIDDGFLRSKAAETDTAREPSLQSVQSAVGKKRQQYARKLATETELVVSKFGHFIGYTQRKFTVKHRGVVVASIPKERLKRLVISSPGVTLSSDCIHQCCKRNISIEFLSGRGEPFAMIYTPQFGITQACSAQISARDTEVGPFLARQFLKGKARNQANLLKYFNKYLKRVEPEKGAVVAANIQQMTVLAKNITEKRDDEPRETFRNRIMGIEGNISTYYWNSLKEILPPELGFQNRVTQGARDLFNSTLNYGYGILYNRVQQALADAGAALHVSFLHEPQGKKPTLVYDLIEEFRQFVVDRTVIALFNRQEPLKTDAKGWLTPPARQLIVQNVQERLGSYVRWRKKHWKTEDIIFHQARLLMHHIRGEKRYRPFIGRY